jgi:hypothetical protein
MKWGVQTLCRLSLAMVCLSTVIAVAVAAAADSATDPALDKVLSQMDSAAGKIPHHRSQRGLGPISKSGGRTRGTKRESVLPPRQ